MTPAAPHLDLSERARGRYLRDLLKFVLRHAEPGWLTEQMADCANHLELIADPTSPEGITASVRAEALLELWASNH